jgi:hypothetical protein
MIKSLFISLLFFAQIPFPGPGRAPVGGGGGGNTFTLVKNVQNTSGVTNGGTTEGPSNNGSVAVLMFHNNSGVDFTSLSISGGGTWTAPAACHNGSGSVGYIACAYNLSTTTAATVTVTYSGGSIATVSIWEYTPSGTPSLDDTNSCSIGAGNPINGCTPSLSGSNDVIVQGISIASSQASSVGGGYGNILINSPNYAAAADIENSASTTPPAWTLTGSSAAYGSWVAIK